MLLNARKVFYENNNHTTILLAIEDITERRAAERALQDLLHQKELLVEEMQHRIANSLQIIASIILMKTRSVKSEEARMHLKDAHERVLSVAAVQKHLQPTGRGEEMAVAPYLTKLCETLTQSMISGSRSISLEVLAGEGTQSTGHAVSIGLIVTEGVLNALKHAFPVTKLTEDCRIIVTYAVDGADWTLSIADNGMGKPTGDDQSSAGLGTSIVQALAQQLGARVEVTSSPNGTTLALHHAGLPTLLPQAA
jgi:chemotaxis protein methyltransferase CheR